MSNDGEGAGPADAIVSDFSGFSIEDLKVFAGARCLDIFDDFDAAEIGRQPASVREAWKVGRAISELGKRGSR